ncbi:MAG: threonine synthase [bacterium]
MLFHSTRGDSKCPVSEAINTGLADDGGLFVPEAWPKMGPNDFSKNQSFSQVAYQLIKPFFKDDRLGGELEAICDQAFNFSVPVKNLDSNLGVIELFHGPTSAFKDFGARFLAQCLSRLEKESTEKLNILVATSGDTGGAVAGAFDGIENIDVVVLYPKGLVSPRQEHQLCCWSDNIHSVRVAGRFDDCQALVKEAFVDEEFSNKYRLTSANSISVGRLLPQMSYYAYSSLQHWHKTGEKLNYVIPAGNVGNSLACIWAKKIGMPIGDVVLATNENKTIPDFLQSNQWEPRESKATLASAMDVGNPSNMERLRHLLPDHDQRNQAISAYSVTDKQIEEQIKEVYQQWNYMICPHTATAFHVYNELNAEQKNKPWIVVSTAHPAKFETIVEPLLGVKVPVPKALEDLLERPIKRVDISPQLDMLDQAMH